MGTTRLLLLACWLLIGCFTSGQEEELIDDVVQAQEFLDNIDRLLQEELPKGAFAAWDYYTNLTDENQDVMLDSDLKVTLLYQEIARNATRYNMSVMSQQMRHEFLGLRDIGTAAQTNETKVIRLSQILADMERVYSTAEVCLSTTKRCHPLEPDLTDLFTTSENYDELTEAWKGWRDQSGKKIRNMYREYVELSNEAVRMSGHADMGAYWRGWYETPEFEDDVRALFDQLRPLYEHLHAYVRRKLKQKFGADKFPASGHIPAHLFGNMWAQQWNSLMDDIIPFKGKPSLDVTPELVRQGYTPLKIFQAADDFFTSLGMIPMPPEFWNHSMLEKPTDGRDVVCHASAWDFLNGKDFRIQQCTEVNWDHFETAHHEMGHIQYYLQYKDQPLFFRFGANPGFHEAVGDVISLSVGTMKHLHSVGLISEIPDDEESDINFLLNMALNKIAFLPFGYLIDQWRWSVFRGDTRPNEYNEHWWQLRCRYQGIFPPVERSEDDFDPGAKYHIPGNVPYIRYFVAFVNQFQFYKALCDISGHTGPLYKCDIYNSTSAGTALSNMLKLGSSQPWPVAMEMLTNQTKMDAQPLMDYFKPLLDYLRKENGNDYGWHPQCPTAAFYRPNSGLSLSDGDTRLRAQPVVTFFLFAFLCIFKSLNLI